MRFLAVLFVLLMAVGGGWLMSHQNHSALEVVYPVIGPAVRGVYATGTVEASVMMPIAPRTGARLMELHADEGSKVSKDQVLAQLEDDDLKHNLQELRTRAEFAKKDYDRNAALVKQKAVSVEVYERAKSDWQAAEAAVQAANAQLGYLKLMSPAEGTIIRRDGEVGQMIPANQPVFWLSCCAPLRISAEVDEEDIAEVQPGQKVLIRADAFPGKVFHGEVQAITPKGDPVARSYRVRVGFTEPTPLMIGMTAETNIVIREVKDALLVPATAISSGKVWVVTGGALKAVSVVTGARGTKQSEIKEGLSKDDLVVVSPSPALKEGAAPKTRLLSQ